MPGTQPPPTADDTIQYRTLSASEFAAQIKAQYPVYKDWDDHDLTSAMLEKYPEYSTPTKNRPWAVEPQGKTDSQGATIAPREPGFGEKLLNTVRNSAVGHGVEEVAPGLADALHLHPNEGVNSPDYAAHRQQLIAPEELIDQNQPETLGGAVASGARGGLKAVGAMTTAPNLLMLAAGGALPKVIGALGGEAALTRLAASYPGLAKVLAQHGSEYILSRLVAGGFTLDMVKDLVQQSPELGKAIGEGRTNDAAEMIGNMAATGYFAKLAGEHAAGKGHFAIGDDVQFKQDGQVIRGKVADFDGKTFKVESGGKTFDVKRGKMATAGPVKPKTTFTMADEGELEKLGYTKQQMDRLQPFEVESILQHKIPPGQYKFTSPAQPKARAAAASASGVEPPPAPPTPAAAVEPPAMELSPEQLAQAHQLTEGARSELDNMAYEQGFGKPEDLVAAVREKASRGEDLSDSDKRVMQLAEGDLTAKTSAKAELDRLAYEQGYGSTGDYIKDVIARKVALAKDKEAYEAGFGDPEQMERYRQSQSQGEALMRIAYGDDATALKESVEEPGNQSPVGQPASGAETPTEESQAQEPSVSEETPAPPPNTPEPGVSAPAPEAKPDLITSTKQAIKDTGLVDKGHLAHEDLLTFQIEHPDHPGYTTTAKRAELEGLTPDATQRLLKEKMRAHLLKNGRKIPENLMTAADRRKGNAEYTPGETVNGHYGRPTAVETPNGTHEAYYRVVEAEDLKPSHDAHTFNENPNYPKGVQERRYDANQNAQNEVDKYVRDRKWSLYVNNDPTPINGPSQSLPDGTVLGGNGRTMALQRAYRSQGGEGEEYKQHLIEHAAEFGLNPDVIQQMKHPVLDRVLINAPHDIESLRRIGSDLNKSFTKKTSVVEAAVSAGKNLSLQSATKISDAIAGAGEDSSLREVMNDNPLLFRDILLNDGIMREGDLPQFFEGDGTLNDTGKNFIENMLLGSVLRDPDIMQLIPASLKNKLTRALPDLMEVAHRDDRWNILDDLRDAVRQHIKSQSTGKKLNDLLDQVSFDENGNPQPPVDQRVADLAKALNKKPTQVAEMFKQFADDARQDMPGQESMFGKPDVDGSFERIFSPETQGFTKASLAFKKGATSPPPRPPSSRTGPGSTGMSTEIPTEPMRGHVGEAMKETVEPAAKEAFRNIADSADTIRQTFAPGYGDQSADKTKLIIRRRAAERAETMELVRHSFEGARKFFQQFDRETRMRNLSMIDAGKAEDLARELNNPDIVKFANLMKETREAVFKKALALKRPTANLLNPDYYLAHLYKTADGEPLGSYLSRRPLEGAKSFFKKRQFPTMGEFINYAKENLGVDVEPMFDNPVDFEFAKIGEITKFIEGHQIMEDHKAAGTYKFVHVLDGAKPEGYTKVDDPVGTVYAPPNYTVTEAFDHLMYQRMRSFMQDLGIKHSRRVNIGGDDRWGYAEMGGANRITSKAGGPLRVITHEIGHILDDKYDLANKWVGDPWVKVELRKLADLRYEQQEPSPAYKKYVREGSEKIANLVDAYVHSREQAEEVAPTAVRYLDSLIDEHPELEGLRQIKPSMVLGSESYQVPTGTLNIMGHVYLPDKSASVLNNYLSPGLQGKAPFRMYQYVGNFMNQAQLGWSAFHMVFTANDAAISKAALGIQQIVSGEYRKGFTSLAKGNIVIAPIETYLKGNKVLKEFYGTPQGQVYADAINNLIHAGGRVKMDALYHNSALQSFWDAWHGGNKLGAGARHGVPALFEWAAKPIMEDWVPRMKLGVFMDLAEHEMGKLPEGATIYEREAVLARAWDSVDDRMGQLVYDNLFIDRTLKDIGLASVRSLGWNIGDFRQFGGAAVDLTQGVRRAVTGKGRLELTPRMAYVIALPMVMGLQGAFMHYMFNGKGPDELKDYFFPRTGRFNSDGTPERVSTPSYLKDVYAYGSGFQRGPVAGVKQFGETLSHKLHPAISAVLDMLQNKDFYGVEIRNPSDPAVEQLKDIMKFVGSQYVSFSFRNAQQRNEAAGVHGLGSMVNKESVQALFGILPAPRSLDRTEAEQMAADYANDQLPRGSRSKDQFERGKLRNEIAQELKQQDPDAFQKLQAALESGQLNHGDMRTIRQRLRSTYLQALVTRLSLKKSFAVYDAATPEEKAALRPVIAKKKQLLFSISDPEERSEYMKRLNDLAGEADGAQTPKRAAPLSTPYQSPVTPPPTQ